MAIPLLLVLCRWVGRPGCRALARWPRATECPRSPLFVPLFGAVPFAVAPGTEGGGLVPGRAGA